MKYILVSLFFSNVNPILCFLFELVGLVQSFNLLKCLWRKWMRNILEPRLIKNKIKKDLCIFIQFHIISNWIVYRGCGWFLTVLTRSYAFELYAICIWAICYMQLEMNKLAKKRHKNGWKIKVPGWKLAVGCASEDALGAEYASSDHMTMANQSTTVDINTRQENEPWRNRCSRG